MTDEPSQPIASLEEQLVAYLDGELDAEARRHIEELLATDSRVRQTLHGLERTWDLLEELDAPPTGEKFTQSTLEMVAIAGRQEVENALAEVPRRRRRRWVMIGTGLFIATLIGFLAVAVLIPNPNRQLLQDLPILDQFDEYRQIGNIEFLRMLRDEGLFSKEASDDTTESEDTLPQHQPLIKNMSPSEKEQLRQVQTRFAALDPTEQQQLRQLHELLQEDPNAEQLRQSMRLYYRWLKTLPTYSRAELTELKPADRIEWIEKRLQEEQARESEKQLSEKDTKAVMQWFNDHISKQEAAFLQSLPETRRIELKKMSEPMRRQAFWQMAQRWQAADSGSPLPMMTDDDLIQLRGKLSQKSQKLLEDKLIREQWRIVVGWTRLAMRQQVGGRLFHGPVSKADDERLAEFFENELNDEERDRLLNLSGEEMQRELLRLYLTHVNPTERPGFPSEGPDHHEIRPDRGSPPWEVPDRRPRTSTP